MGISLLQICTSGSTRPGQIIGRYLYISKVFLLFCFTIMQKSEVFEEGPWFWERPRHFITPWFPEFDSNTLSTTRMPVWVCLPNLPLHFWNLSILENIGNTLGRDLKTYIERATVGLFTYAHIYVEIDLSKGLLDKIIFK